MTAISRRLIVAILALPLLLIVARPGQLQAASLEFVPSFQSVPLGTPVSVDVFLADPGGVLVGAYDLTITWDASILSYSSTSFGVSLGAPLDSLVDVVPGVANINVAETSFLFDLAALQDGTTDFLLFTLDFNTIGLGLSPLEFSSSLLSDDLGFAITSVSLGDGEVEVTDGGFPTVPEPGTWLLITSGLLLSALFRSRSEARLQ